MWCVVRFGACGACDACDAFGCTVTGKYATSAPTAIGGVYSLPPAHFAEQAQAEEAEAARKRTHKKSLKKGKGDGEQQQPAPPHRTEAADGWRD